jgi:hypothetical protein
VIYGETTAYGQIATDQDMAGGAHSDHNPLMGGLKPDTTYHYRVQGTSADGTLYVSEDYIFRTPAATEATERNLASLDSGAIVAAVSSNFGGAANDEPWGANNAIDGSRATAWSSAGDGDAAFLEIELAQDAQINAIEVWTRSMADGTAIILRFSVLTDRGETLGPFMLEDAESSQRFAVDARAQRLRLEVIESTGGNTGLVEFAAYGEYVEQ